MNKCICQIVCFSLLLIGCQDEIGDKDTNDMNVIECIVSATSFLNTKGTPISSEDNALFKEIGLVASHTDQEFDKTQNPTPNFFNNTLLSKNSAGKWGFNQIYYWPQKGYLSFFAYAPFANKTNGIVIENSQAGIPQINYTLPVEVANQPDLMISVPEKDLFKTNVDLQFTHALSCIGFDVSGDNVPIEYIGIRNVYTTGTVSLDMNNGRPVWTNKDGKSSDLFKVGLIENPVATDPNETIMAVDGYLMMIPQVLEENAEIVVKFKGIDPKVIKLNTAGTPEWTAGQKYIYSLKEGVYTFNVTPSDIQCVFSGQEIALDFNSTYTPQGGTPQPLGWKAEIIQTSTEDPYWTNIFTNLSNKTGMMKDTSLWILPSRFTTTNSDDLVLQRADSIKYVNIRDLSDPRKINTYNTANTYVVNAPGWYKFPCSVMGNAIVGGGSSSIPNNSKCFSSSAPYFQNYKSENITSLSDLKLDVSNTKAQLYWTDAPGLVTEVDLLEDNNYIRFNIPSETIRQGNAVIALLKGDQVIWSWQIWVTNWVLNTENQAIGNGFSAIMPFGVGRCSAAQYNYQQRSITIRFTQNTSNLTKDVTILQNLATMAYGENCSFYQWGRKDPMLATNGLGLDPKPSYGPKEFIISNPNMTISLNNGILNPNIFYSTTGLPGNWLTTTMTNLWGNFSGAQGIGVKTIYDPSPLGYRVPDFESMEQLVNFNSKFVSSPINGCFFAPSGGTDYTLFLSSNGCRNQNGGAVGDGGSSGSIERFGSYWSNSNFYWATDNVSLSLFLDIIFGENRSPQVFYQSSPASTALNVCSCVDQITP